MPVSPTIAFKSPLHEMTQTTSTCLWNDSASLTELSYSIENGAVGATCNPVIAVGTLKKEMADWKPRILGLIEQNKTATESEIGWRLVEEMSIQAAALLEPIFHQQKGKNGRLSIQTDPRFFNNPEAIVNQAVHFDGLAPEHDCENSRYVCGDRSH